jgi:hypothetical protein
VDNSETPYTFFLGGHDLEMVTIRELLASKGIPYFDRQLSWGAKVSDYRTDIEASISGNKIPVLVELTLDLQFAESVIVIDHHNQGAGEKVPTSLEQVFQLLQCPSMQWTRHFDLVAANDRSHIQGMLELNPPATLHELRRIRALDRKSQGITAEEEASGIDALRQRKMMADGKLTVVSLPHTRTAIATDFLHWSFEGPGYQDLWIDTPTSSYFFGRGDIIKKLSQEYPDCWFGGNLPRSGFWGTSYPINRVAIIDEIERILTMKPAAQIKVKAFHHILLWPLILRPESQFSANRYDENEFVGPYIQALEKAGWEKIAGEANSHPANYSYEEFVYFHPFARDLLFHLREGDSQDRILYRMSRQDLTSLLVKVPATSSTAPELCSFEIDLKVERSDLILLRPCIAMLVLELSNRKHPSPEQTDPEIRDSRWNLNLHQVMRLQSQLRHIFPPYFQSPNIAGDCVTDVEWRGPDGQNIFLADGSRRPYSLGSPKSEFEEFVLSTSEPPVFWHWSRIFQPVDLSRNDGPRISFGKCHRKSSGPGLVVQQLLDDRMPGMSFIAVENPDDIGVDDRDCLTDFNESGFVYSEDFRDRQRHLFTYDRFSHFGTTYFCNGTSFAMVCNAPLVDAQCFSDQLLKHFRRHYRHLAILAHLQHSALIYFADEIADIARSMKSLKKSVEFEIAGGNEKWSRRLDLLQFQFLVFRTSVFFTEVSNQIQGKDLYKLWYDRLGTEGFFEKVKSSYSDIISSVQNAEQHGIAREQKRISRLATVGLAFSIGLSIAAFVLAWAQFLPESVRKNPVLKDVLDHGAIKWLLTSLILGSISALIFYLWYFRVRTEEE